MYYVLLILLTRYYLYLSKIVGLFLPSLVEILDFLVSLSTLSGLNDFLQNHGFVVIAMGDFRTTKNYLKIISC